MILLGADVNKRTSNEINAINWSLHHAENIMDSPNGYPYSQEKVREQLSLILDCLIENGADYKEWLEEGYYPEPCPGPSIRNVFWCELVHRPFNKYHIKQMQIQSLQYHPFCISSGKQLVPC